MRSKLIVISLLFFSGATSWADEDLNFKVGPVTTRILPGNILDQPSEAIVLSHAPDTVNVRSRDNAAVWNAGGRKALELYWDIVSGQGQLAYMTVTDIPLDTGSRLHAKYLLNVVELSPMNQIMFTTVEQVRESVVLSKADKRKYTKLINDNATKISVFSPLDDPKAAQSIFEEIQSSYKSELNDILNNYRKELPFFTAALSIRNALWRADELGLQTLAVGTLGHGSGGDLDLTQSVGAIMTGIKLYVSQSRDPKAHEIRIVVNDKVAGNDRKNLAAQLIPAFGDGEFIHSAAATIRETALSHLQRQPRAVKPAGLTLKDRTVAACREWLSKAKSLLPTKKEN